MKFRVVPYKPTKEIIMEWITAYRAW
jgi:hypothetical protein